MPLVSVIIPCFNRERFIAQAIGSVLSQSCTDFELIVVDDGSTDGTGKLVSTRFNNQVQVISQPNLGRGVARQTGLAKVRSDYVAMVDSDIRLPKDWLARCIIQIEGKVGVGGVAIPDGD